MSCWMTSVAAKKRGAAKSVAKKQRHQHPVLRLFSRNSVQLQTLSRWIGVFGFAAPQLRPALVPVSRTAVTPVARNSRHLESTLLDYSH